MHVENTHEGIIDRELCQQVQSKIQEYTEAYKKKHQQNNGAIRNHNFYTGKIWCGGCGNRMTLSREDVYKRQVLKRMDLKYWQIYYQLIQIQK